MFNPGPRPHVWRWPKLFIKRRPTDRSQSGGFLIWPSLAVALFSGSSVHISGRELNTSIRMQQDEIARPLLIGIEIRPIWHSQTRKDVQMTTRSSGVELSFSMSDVPHAILRHPLETKTVSITILDVFSDDGIVRRYPAIETLSQSQGKGIASQLGNFLRK